MPSYHKNTYLFLENILSNILSNNYFIKYFMISETFDQYIYIINFKSTMMYTSISMFKLFNVQMFKRM